MIKDRQHVHEPADIVLVPGAAMANRRAGLSIIIGSNQSRLARGLFGWNQAVAVEHRIATLLFGCRQVDARRTAAPGASS